MSMVAKLGLEIHGADKPSSARALRDLLAITGDIFEKNRSLIQVKRGADGKLFIREMTKEAVIHLAHNHCQPFRMVQQKQNTVEVPITLPMDVAALYLDLHDWQVPPIAGIATSPLLHDDGSIVAKQGYDKATQTYCDCRTVVEVAACPTLEEARAALQMLRKTFATFPFADAVMVQRGPLKYIDLNQPARLHESTFLAGLLTGVCRPSLWFSPALLFDAPSINGSGSGKGKLAWAVSHIAFGFSPRKSGKGHEMAEFDKRLVGKLIGCDPVVFFDNINGTALRSDTLASVITERPAEVRVLGTSTMQEVNSSALIILTGNGLNVSEDLARRILKVRLDAQMEDPEARPFPPGFENEIEKRRNELLAACLTIWRWGRQNRNQLVTGLPAGGFETWAEWVRDPLLTLGCADAVAGMRAAKQRDPLRQKIAELFSVWWNCHKADAVKGSELHKDVTNLIDPQNKGRQFIATELEKLDGTMSGGLVLSRHKGSGMRSVATYQLTENAEYIPELKSTPHDAYAPIPPNAGEKVLYIENKENGGVAVGQYPHADHAGLEPGSEQKSNIPKRSAAEWRQLWNSPEWQRKHAAWLSRYIAEADRPKSRRVRLDEDQ